MFWHDFILYRLLCGRQSFPSLHRPLPSNPHDRKSSVGSEDSCKSRNMERRDKKRNFSFF